MQNGFRLLIRDILYMGLIDEKNRGRISRATVPLRNTKHWQFWQ
jgi:hypothetical protein